MKEPTIFLSSVVHGLENERNAAAEVIQKLQHKISRCEYYAARTESPKQVCLNEAKNCNVFVGIYKKDYGHIPENNNPEQFSVCEMEYNEAKKKNKKPILLFYSSDFEGRDTALDSFLKKIKHFSKGHYVLKYNSIDELKYLLLHSLVFNLNDFSSNDDEKNALEELIPDMIKYRRFLLDQFEYNTTSGVSRPSTLLQYRMKDLFVPPEIKKFDMAYNKSESVKEHSAHPLRSIRLIHPLSSWKNIERIVKEQDKDQKNITTGLDIILKIEEHRPIVLLGDPGSGKSTLMKFLCNDLILNSSILPMYVQIRDFASHVQITNNDSVLEYLKDKHRELNLDSNFFDRQLNAGSCLIIFDGLDEVWEASERKRMNDIIQRFCSSWYLTNKIFITSRIPGYFQNPLINNVEVLKLSLFDNEKISEFVYKWATLLEKSKSETPNPSLINENYANLYELILNDSNLEKLSRTPLILNVICLTFMKNMIFPKRKHLVYAILTETLLSTRESRKGIESGNFDWTDYMKFLKEISFWMFSNDKLQIDEEKIIELIKSRLEKEGITNITTTMFREILTRLEERSGLIGSDGLGNYFFSHLSFLEYFVALELCERYNEKEIYEFFKPRLHNTKNLEVISFISSILSDKSRIIASNFLNYILTNNTIHNELHLLDLILVIKCLSDGTLISDKLYEDVFQTIDDKWSKKRNNDFYFMSSLEQFISTPYEHKIVNMWRKKCHSDNSFYKLSPLVNHIIEQSEYVNDLIDCANNILSKDNDKDIIIVLTFISLLQQRPSKKLAEYVLTNITKLDIPIFLDGIIFGVAKYIQQNSELKEEYFSKISEIDDDYIKRCLIQYSYIIDKELAKKSLSNLPQNDENKNFTEHILGKKKEKLGPHEARMKRLENIKSKNDFFDMFFSSLSGEIERMDEFDKEYFYAILKTLDEISPEKSLEALSKSEIDMMFQCCDFLDKLYEKFDESKDLITYIMTNPTKQQTRFLPFLQNILLKQDPENNEVQKTFLNLIKNKKLPITIRRKNLNLLFDHFPDDPKSQEILVDLIQDKDLNMDAVSIIKKFPDLLEKNISKIISLCETTEDNIFGNAVFAVRKYIINYHSIF